MDINDKIISSLNIYIKTFHFIMAEDLNHQPFRLISESGLRLVNKPD